MSFGRRNTDCVSNFAYRPRLEVRLTDEGLAVLTADVVPDDAVIVAVVEHGQAELVALGVVRLREAQAAREGPVAVEEAHRVAVAPDEPEAVAEAGGPDPSHACGRNTKESSKPFC